MERRETAITVFAAKAFALGVGLNMITGIFEVMEIQSTLSKYNFDRYWRD
ncbi:hypothetical protein [Brasilonema sp. UFV-L1]|nr:hypothetical protein [Brasilonema sp. UFV-L1]